MRRLFAYGGSRGVDSMLPTLILAPCLLLILVTGCGKEARAQTSRSLHAVITPEATTSFVEVDGVRIDVDNELEFRVTLGHDGLVHRVDDRVVDVVDGQFVLGDVRYGAVRPGDSIFVGADGIEVNGVLRSGSH